MLENMEIVLYFRSTMQLEGGFNCNALIDVNYFPMRTYITIHTYFIVLYNKPVVQAAFGSFDHL